MIKRKQSAKRKIEEGLKDVREGRIIPIKDMLIKKRKLPPRKPLRVKGKPASEIIIEERGRTLKEHIAEHMKDPEFRKAWHDLDPEFGLIEEMLKAGEKKNK